jgi:mono/diheme cytochrome c family protein
MALRISSAFRCLAVALTFVVFTSIGLSCLPARAADNTPADNTPTDVFLGLTPDAAKGFEILMNAPMAAPIMKAADIDRLWTAWEDEEKAKAEKAAPADRRRMTFERYGWATRPGEDFSALPLDFTADGKGNLVTNCFSCHGGKVAGVTIPGAGNTHLDLTTLSTDLNRLRALDNGKDPAEVKDTVAPFHTPLNFHRGVTNAVIFAPVFAGLRDPKLARQFNEHPEMLLHHDMNPPAWWNFKKKTRIYADAFAPKTPRQLMPFAMSPTFSDEKFRSFEPNFVHIYQYIEELEAPKYPYAVDADLAARGKALFENTCSECHGTYGPGGEFPNRVVPIEEVGTDSRRFHAIYKDRREAGNKGWLQYFGEHPLEVETTGYLAQPLTGIWASAPYFHNGSVPTLWHVMNPAKRPKTWKRSENGYDQQKVGLEVEVLDAVPDNLSTRQRRTYYDTTHVGNSAQGHTFPDALNDDEKLAVIEYLKTL